MSLGPAAPDLFFTTASAPRGRRWLTCAAALVIAVCARAETDIAFDISAGSAEAALKTFSAQSDQQVIAPAELLAGVRTAAVRGNFTPAHALEQMFVGTALAAVASNGAFAIVPRTAPKPPRAPALNAAAVIAIGLAVDDKQSARFQRLAAALRDALAQHGIPESSIALVPETAGERVRRDAVLAALRAVKPGVDETWLVLIGQIAAGRDGAPMFQVSGPRLAADDFAAAVKTLPGRKFVLLATTSAGAFLPPLLALPDVEAVAATAESGETSEPRFPAAWAEVLSAQPTASFRRVAIEAASRVEAFYRGHQLGQGEHAQLIDRAQEKILSAPFSDAASAVTNSHSP
jgi:hypothetical protein